MRHAEIPQIAPVGTPDAELVQRARARDEAAIRIIMQSNNRRLYRLARGILRNDGEAEDVVQETYVRAFTHLDGFRGDLSLATWPKRRLGCDDAAEEDRHSGLPFIWLSHDSKRLSRSAGLLCRPRLYELYAEWYIN